MRDFKKIQVWEKAHGLTLQLYKVTASFPNDSLDELIDFCLSFK